MSGKEEENFVPNTLQGTSQVFRGGKWVDPTQSPSQQHIFSTAETSEHTL